MSDCTNFAKNEEFQIHTYKYYICANLICICNESGSTSAFQIYAESQPRYLEALMCVRGGLLEVLFGGRELFPGSLSPKACAR
jgi:hypothetical protein